MADGGRGLDVEELGVQGGELLHTASLAHEAGWSAAAWAPTRVSDEAEPASAAGTVGPVGEVARASTPRGEIVLSRRGDTTLELRVNGVFVMDTAETSSERLLARAALESWAGTSPGSSLSVLMGGLGLGYTLREVLADGRLGRVVVAEIEADLVDWHRRGIVPPGQLPPFEDARVEVVVADVREVVAAQPAASLDVVLLDVDNGPGFLVYDDNAAIYREEFLAACAATLRPGGVVAIWSAERSQALTEAMERVHVTVEQWPIPVILGTRATSYHLFVGRPSA